MNKDINDTTDAERGSVTPAGHVELDESQLDQVTGGGVKKKAVPIKFDGVDGESVNKDHTG